MSEEKNAIESAILNIGDKMKDIMAISEQPVEPALSEVDAAEDTPGDEFDEPGENGAEETPRSGRKRGEIRIGARGRSDGFTNRVDGTKSLTVRLLPGDLKKLRLIALSNERSPRDEIVSMIQERYKQMAKSILTEE